MTTSLDTNILAVQWGGQEAEALAAQRSLDRSAAAGPLIICAPVYAELLAAPGRGAEFVDTFLGRTGITVDWHLDESAWREAGFAFRSYAERRRTETGGQSPLRILADFLIGAHALRRGAVLLSFDTGIYRRVFPTLRVQSPNE